MFVSGEGAHHCSVQFKVPCSRLTRQVHHPQCESIITVPCLSLCWEQRQNIYTHQVRQPWEDIMLTVLLVNQKMLDKLSLLVESLMGITCTTCQLTDTYYVPYVW